MPCELLENEISPESVRFTFKEPIRLILELPAPSAYDPVIRSMESGVVLERTSPVDDVMLPARGKVKL